MSCGKGHSASPLTACWVCLKCDSKNFLQQCSNCGYCRPCNIDGEIADAVADLEAAQ
jgi:hypothetical protein